MRAAILKPDSLKWNVKDSLVATFQAPDGHLTEAPRCAKTRVVMPDARARDARPHALSLNLEPVNSVPLKIIGRVVELDRAG